MPLPYLWPALFWTWTASEVVLAISTHTRSSEGSTRDRGSIFILWVAIFGSIVVSDPIAEALPGLRFSGQPWLKPLTLILMAVGLTIRWVAILSLGQSFSVNVAIHATQTVYRKGLYRLVRHPSYLGMLFIFLAIGLRTRNAASLAILLIVPTAALLHRIRIEEAALTQAFGSEYQAYCLQTKRLIPGIY